ncbi:MAG: Swt1 family HEPN domain-containing protein [Candidatus Eremiobacteraeota bacterium]|nr:Swt1 family HEPN domain-containing protein [Candidatus Eremiobacteraeota bacterium]
MIPVYATYYCFENSIREFVAEAMKDVHGDAWWDKVPQKIRVSVEGRKKQLEKHKWYTYEPPSNISQLLFGDLASIITDQWTLFEPFFPNQEWVRVRLNELEMSRNVIAHANELPEDEIDRLRRYLEDWLSQVPT